VENKGAVDFFSAQYHKRETNEDGTVKSDLQAEKMQHYHGDGSTHLDKPQMTLYSEPSPPWLIQAEQGILAADHDHLQLGGKALIKREAGKGVKALTIDTSNLQVTLSRHYAQTQERAEIISPPNRTSGTGMEVTFISPIHLKLLSKVKGRYELD
jgi:lipopolysaccharide export system protein LptC